MAKAMINTGKYKNKVSDKDWMALSYMRILAGLHVATPGGRLIRLISPDILPIGNYNWKWEEISKVYKETGSLSNLFHKNKTEPRVHNRKTYKVEHVKSHY